MSKKLSGKGDLSPDGAAVCSLGREPWDHETPDIGAPEGRQKFWTQSHPCRPSGARKAREPESTPPGLTPWATSCRPSGAEYKASGTASKASETEGPWVALDIGGANIKAAHQSGRARSLPFELWKRPEDLTPILESVLRSFPTFSRVALTMTAELCDCYETKTEGVLDVLNAVIAATLGRKTCVWGVDRRFHHVQSIQSRPLLAAASNWLALAEVAARLVPTGAGILIDIGSTTTDLIPLADCRIQPRGKTDTERLQTGELVYAGVRRTPVCAIATVLPFRGVTTGLAAELFASTLDVYLTLGEIDSDPNDLSTADGRAATREAARHRLARMVGADRLEFSPDDAVALAIAADEALLTRLEAAAIQACGATVGPPRSAVVAGSGEALGHRLARRLVGPDAPIVSLREAWGPVTSTAACAHALVILARERAEADLAAESPS